MSTPDPVALMEEPAARGLSLLGEPLPYFAEPIHSPIGTTVPRRAHSVRRTMSIDVYWPEGIEGPGHYVGRCRDIATQDAGSDPVTLAEAVIDAIAANREIKEISATPTPPRLQELVGVRAGGYLRNALAETVPEEKLAGTPLYLLLDDMAGATLVSGWAFSRWRTDWLEQMASRQKSDRRAMKGVCIGFRPGSSALDEGGQSRPSQNASRVVPLRNPADPQGWHDLPHFEGVTFRRARRIDVWQEGAEIAVEAHFQDSASAPDGGDRWCIHEYLLTARIGADGVLRTLDARPGSLPYPDCRAAPTNNAVLIGTPARDLRDTVLEKLKFTGGCTHLNDMLRSLAEAPLMAEHLPG